MAAIDRLEQVDTSAVDELALINSERNLLEERLAKLEARRETASQEVVYRVRGDYESQLQALEARSLKPRMLAQDEYRKLLELHEEYQNALESARLDQEEVTLRNKIGEFEPSEFEKRKRQCRKVVKERQATIAASDELRTKFLSAFPSEEDLLQHPAEPEEAASSDAKSGPSAAQDEQSVQVPDGATVLISRADLDAMAASTQDTASSTVQAAETDAPAARDIDTPLESKEVSQFVPDATVLLPKLGIEALKHRQDGDDGEGG